MTDAERTFLRFFPPTPKLTVNSDTLDITVDQEITESFEVNIGIISGQLILVPLQITVISDPGKHFIHSTCTVLITIVCVLVADL